MAVPLLKYGYENWVPSRVDRNDTETEEKKFLRRVSGNSLCGHANVTVLRFVMI